MRRAISSETWQQIKTANARGIGLREIARNMGIPEGTVLAHSKRDKCGCLWTTAKGLFKLENTAAYNLTVDLDVDAIGAHTECT